MNGEDLPQQAASQATAPPSLRFLYTLKAQLGAVQVVGDGPYGLRRIIPIEGGTFAGPRLRGRVLPGGADWQFIRPDGVAELDARYTLETDDGALIYVSNPGIRTASEDVMERLMRGEECDPSEYYFRTRPVFETGSPTYQWLHRIVGVGTGERLPDEVVITIYELT